LLARTALLLLGVMASFGPVANKEEMATKAPALVLRDLEGHEQDLERLHGRIVVLNFWATWCLPCRQEMPLLSSIQKRHGPSGVQVIAASLDDSDAHDDVGLFVRRHSLKFPVWLDASVDDMERFGLGDELPATVLIDRDGTVAGRILGPADAKDLERRIEWLLGDRGEEPPPPVVDNLPERPAGEADHGHHEGDEHQHDHGPGGKERASKVPS
jgi:thiol-disulfide isomerase/thioredoxin